VVLDTLGAASSSKAGEVAGVDVGCACGKENLVAGKACGGGRRGRGSEGVVGALGEEGESSERGFVRWGENRKLGVCVLCVLVVEYNRELVYSIIWQNRELDTFKF
jgi:hypothetical protein